MARRRHASVIDEKEGTARASNGEEGLGREVEVVASIGHDGGAGDARVLGSMMLSDGIVEPRRALLILGMAGVKKAAIEHGWCE